MKKTVGMMKTNGIEETLREALTELEEERDRLEGQISAIEGALNGTAPRQGRKPGRVAGRRSMTPAARKEVSRRMKAYWLGRRVAKAKAARAAARPKRKVRRPAAKAIRVVVKRRVAPAVARKPARKVSAPATRKAKAVRKKKFVDDGPVQVPAASEASAA